MNTQRPFGMDDDEVDIRLQLTVRNYEQLSELLNRLTSIRNVLEARRLRESPG